MWEERCTLHIYSHMVMSCNVKNIINNTMFFGGLMRMSHFFGPNKTLKIHIVKDLKAKERTYLHGEFYFAYTNEKFLILH